MFKFRTLIIMAVVLMAVLFTTIAFAETEVAQTTATQQEEVLKQQAAARSEARKLAIQKQADREAAWAKAVSKLSFEESMEWSASDSTGSQVEKLDWLSKRWVKNYGFEPLDPKATLDDVIDSMYGQIADRREKARVRAEIDARIGASIKPLQDNLQEQINAGATADLNMAILIADLEGQIVELRDTVEKLSTDVTDHETRLTSAERRLDEVERSGERVLELMGYAKYNGGPENAERVHKFVGK